MPQQPNTLTALDNAGDWKLLFSSLLQTKVEDLDFEIKVSDDEIIISTQEEKQAQKLTEILRSPEAVLSSVGYTLEEIVQGNKPVVKTELHEPHYPQPLSLVPGEEGEGVKIYEQIFGEKVLQRFGRLNWTRKIDHEGRYLLAAEYEAELESLTKAQIENYKRVLSCSSFLELRKALALKSSEYAALSINQKEQGFLAQHIDKIIFQGEDKDGPKSFYFDIGLLVNCLTAPAIRRRIVDLSYSHQFSITKKHLLSYLSVIFKEGFILHTQEQQARPICFNIQRAVKVENKMSLILDCSGSMAMKGKINNDPETWNAYIQQVENFIDKVSEEKSYTDSEIIITPFASARGLRQTFSLKDTAAIKAYLRTLQPGGCTRLSGTIYDELIELEKEGELKNTTLVVFTDGKDEPLDEQNTQYQKDLVGAASKLNEKTNPPKIYTLGLGDRYDKVLMDNLARNTGAEHIALKSIKDFEKISNHCRNMGRARRLAHFIQKGVAEFIVPAYVDDLSVAKKSLNLSQNFSVGGNEYFAKPGAPRLIVAPLPAPVEPVLTSPAMQMKISQISLASEEGVANDSQPGTAKSNPSTPSSSPLDATPPSVPSTPLALPSSAFFQPKPKTSSSWADYLSSLSRTLAPLVPMASRAIHSTVRGTPIYQMGALLFSGAQRVLQRAHLPVAEKKKPEIQNKL